MATSRSVAAAVRALSMAESLMQRSEGFGVREATTVPDTFNASSKAPRLQITFMIDAFPSREPSSGSSLPLGWRADYFTTITSLPKVLRS
jgi:hypothetical protein